MLHDDTKGHTRYMDVQMFAGLPIQIRQIDVITTEEWRHLSAEEREWPDNQKKERLGDVLHMRTLEQITVKCTGTVDPVPLFAHFAQMGHALTYIVDGFAAYTLVIETRTY